MRSLEHTAPETCPRTSRTTFVSDREVVRASEECDRREEPPQMRLHSVAKKANHDGSCVFSRARWNISSDPDAKVGVRDPSVTICL